MTIDSTTNEPLSDEEIAEKRAQAEELLSQLQASGNLEQEFTDLADTYGEDTGRAAGTGYLINPDTSFVQEFKDAAFALKPGELSGIVESDYGYHILLRKELTGAQLESLAQTHLNDYLDGQLAAQLENAERSEKLDSIDVGAFYTGYMDAVEALHPQEDETQDGGGTDGTGDTAGADGSGE